MERIEFGGLKPTSTPTIEGNKNGLNFAIAVCVIIIAMILFHFIQEHIESKKTSE